MFTKRQKMIMIELLKKSDYLTSRQLALCVGVSVRTIKSEVKRINELLAVYDIHIEAKTGIGYRMNAIGNKEIPDINYFLEDMDYDNYLYVSDSLEGRVHFIACRLLEASDFIKSEALADELFISLSTLSHDLKQVKYIFRNFGIKIMSKPYKGIFVSGKEKNIRNCIDFLCFKYNYKNSESYSIYGYDALEMIDSLYSKLTQIAEFHNFQYPSYSLYDISVQTYIAIQRMKQGKLLQKEEYVCSKEAREITNEFLRYIEDVCSIKMPDTEVCRLQCMVDTLYIIGDISQNKKEYERILNETLKEIRILYDFDFNQEFYKSSSLLLHLEQLIKRCRNDVMIYNPLAERILSNYLLSVDFANVLARRLEQTYHFKISIDEFSYLVLYFNVTIFSSSKMKDKVLYIYCPESRAIEQMIYKEIKHLFEEIVNRITVVTRNELDTMQYSALDIIISNVKLPNSVPNFVPNIYADLNNKMEFISKILIQLNEHVEGYFNIGEILYENMFYNKQNLSSKDEYFEFLFDSLCESLIMDYGEAGHLYSQLEKFGQEIGENVVIIRFSK